MGYLKLRAWEPKDHKFYRCIAGNTDKESNDWICPLIWTGSDWIHSDTCVITMSTGLKDCDGVEIFEGDIVEYNWNLGGPAKHHRKEIVEVRWGSYDDGEYVSDVQCWLIGKYTPLSDIVYDMNEYEIRSVKVIGNVFQTIGK